jgi:hypothetical protein
MTTQEIKEALLDDKQFGNESANWFTLCKASQNLYLIVIKERNLFCKSIDSAAKRISQLIKKGY